VRYAISIAIYLIVGAALSYLVWGPWEGVDPRPFAWWVLAAIAAFHVAVGAVIGRWWALALPLAWAGISIGAEGYDVPVATQILFQAPFIWIPSLALGIALRRVARPRLRPRAS